MAATPSIHSCCSSHQKIQSVSLPLESGLALTNKARWKRHCVSSKPSLYENAAYTFSVLKANLHIKSFAVLRSPWWEIVQSSHMERPHILRKMFHCPRWDTTWVKKPSLTCQTPQNHPAEFTRIWNCDNKLLLWFTRIWDDLVFNMDNWK
jgi:hypothetical protein